MKRVIVILITLMTAVIIAACGDEPVNSVFNSPVKKVERLKFSCRTEGRKIHCGFE